MASCLFTFRVFRFTDIFLRLYLGGDTDTDYKRHGATNFCLTRINRLYIRLEKSSLYSIFRDGRSSDSLDLSRVTHRKTLNDQ